MNRLIYFFTRYQTGLLFTFLLLIGFSFFAFGSSYHQSWYFNRMGNIVFRLHAFRENVLSPGKYVRVNRALSEENALLKAAKIQEVRILVPSNDPRAIVKNVDTTKLLNFHPAKVIYTSLNRKDNVVLLDRGSEDGIQRHMLVMDAHGVVGLVAKTTPHAALVATSLNENVEFNARINTTSEKAVAKWIYSLGRDRILLTEIPHKSKASKGDKVSTFGPVGESNVPGGVPIGTIVSIEASPTGNYLEAEVKLAAQMERLSYVYCIEVKESGYTDLIKDYGDK